VSKAGLGLDDFSIAPRKMDRNRDVVSAATTAAPLPTEKPTAPMLPRLNENHRRAVAETRAVAQEDVRTSLKNLKRSKQRTVKFFVNVALDYDLKTRLQRAAQENDVKMTAVVKAALDYYLSENGY
jgi:hypothetical protein